MKLEWKQDWANYIAEAMGIIETFFSLSVCIKFKLRCFLPLTFLFKMVFFFYFDFWTYLHWAIKITKKKKTVFHKFQFHFFLFAQFQMLLKFECYFQFSVMYYSLDDTVSIYWDEDKIDEINFEYNHLDDIIHIPLLSQFQNSFPEDDKCANVRHN